MNKNTIISEEVTKEKSILQKPHSYQEAFSVMLLFTFPEFHQNVL